MPDERLPKKILYVELQVGKCSYGGQKKRHKDTLKASLKDFNIPTESWEQIAQDRTKWRGGAGEYKVKRISEAEQKRVQRKARNPSLYHWIHLIIKKQYIPFRGGDLNGF